MQLVVEVPFFETVTVISLGQSPAQGSVYARYDCDAPTAHAILSMALRAVEQTLNAQMAQATQTALAQQQETATKTPAPNLTLVPADPDEVATPAPESDDGVHDGDAPDESN